MNLKERKCPNGHVGYYTHYMGHLSCKECNRIKAGQKYYVLKEKYSKNRPDKPDFCKICNSTDLHWYSIKWVCKPCNSKRRKDLYKKNKIFNFYKNQEKNEKRNNTSSSTGIL